MSPEKQGQIKLKNDQLRPNGISVYIYFQNFCQHLRRHKKVRSCLIDCRHLNYFELVFFSLFYAVSEYVSYFLQK